MTNRCDPGAVWWLVGVQLANLRKQAGLSMSQVAAISGISKPKISHLESGRNQQKVDDIRAFARACEASQSDEERIVTLKESADTRTWWGPWAAVVPTWLRTFIGLEGFAKSVFAYEPMIVPGLLQTKTYSEATVQANGYVRPDHFDRIVTLRQARAQRLQSEPRLRMHAVVEDSALRRIVGNKSVVKEQLQHLLQMSELPNVSLQVVCPEDGLHPAVPAGKFTVMGFDKAESVAYVELFEGAVYIHDAGEVVTYKLFSDGIAKAARPLDESREIIETQLRKL